MPSNPVWRVVARKSGARIGDVVSMFTILMLQAGANAEERGRTKSNDDDEIAACLDIEPEQVAAIRAAMQGKVLDGDMLIGWDKHQPRREDGSAERAKRWRESKKSEASDAERERTQANASERPDADADADAEQKKLPTVARRETRKSKLPEDFEPVLTEAAAAHAEALGRDRYIAELEKFKDHHRSKASTMADWQAAFRTWLSNAAQWQQDRQGRNGNGRSGNDRQRVGNNGLYHAAYEAVSQRYKRGGADG